MLPKSIFEENITNIAFLKGNKSYTFVYTKSGEALFFSKSLFFFEKLICDSHFFFRTHKSFIINFSSIRNLIINHKGGFITIDNFIINISRENVPEFRRKYRLYLKNY